MGKENMKNCLSWINFYNPTDDWYYLKEKDKTTYLQKYAQVVEQIKSEGAKLLGSYKCRANSEWSRYDIWEFPTIDIIVKMSNQLEEIGHYQYFEENHVMGRKYNKILGDVNKS